MSEPGEALRAHERALDLRFRDTPRFIELVDALPPGPETTYLQSRVAQWRGRLDEALRLCSEAVEGLAGDTVWRARALETRGNVLNALGLRDEAQASLAHAWRIYEQLGDPVGRASVRQNTAILGFQPLETTLELMRDALVIARGADRDDLLGLILLNLSNELNRLPDRDAALPERRVLLREAGELLERAWPQMALRVRGSNIEIAIEQGDLETADRIAATMPSPLEIGDPTTRTSLALVAGRVALAHGGSPDTADLLGTVLETAPLPEDVPLLRAAQADQLRALGRFEEALDALEQAHRDLLELLAHERSAAGRALDVWHRTSQLREEKDAESERADALERAVAELRVLNKRVKEMSIRDSVTRLHNRQWLMDHAPAVLEQACAAVPAQVALIDLDRFKDVNDTHGHAVGDCVLGYFAAELRRFLPETDLVARYGGEEFVVVRPPAEASRSLARDLRSLGEALAGQGWTDPDGTALPPVTLSAGVVEALPGTLAEALRDADLLMYEAKDLGRDCVRARGDGCCTPAMTAPR